MSRVMSHCVWDFGWDLVYAERDRGAVAQRKCITTRWTSNRGPVSENKEKRRGKNTVSAPQYRPPNICRMVMVYDRLMMKGDGGSHEAI